MWCVCNGSGVSVVCVYVWFFVFVCVFGVCGRCVCRGFVWILWIVCLCVYVFVVYVICVWCVCAWWECMLCGACGECVWCGVFFGLFVYVY